MGWEDQRELEANVKYENQIKNQLEEIKELNKYEARKIPDEINYEQIDNLSKEAREKLTKIRPPSLGAAMRMIAGVNPTDIQVLNYYLNKNYPQDRTSHD